MNKTLARLHDEAGVEPDNLSHVERALFISEQTIGDTKKEIMGLKNNSDYYAEFLKRLLVDELITKEEYEYFKTAQADETYGGLLGILTAKKYGQKVSLQETKTDEGLIQVYLDELEALEFVRVNSVKKNRLQKIEEILSLYKQLHVAKKECKVLCKAKRNIIKNKVK